jgi:hypothetical protein
VLNCALHGGLIRRHIAYPTKKIPFAHPPSPGSFQDQIFVCFSILRSPIQLGFLSSCSGYSGFWNVYEVMFEEVGTQCCWFLTLPLRIVRRPRVSGRSDHGPWQSLGRISFPRTEMAPSFLLDNRVESLTATGVTGGQTGLSVLAGSNFRFIPLHGLEQHCHQTTHM